MIKADLEKGFETVSSKSRWKNIDNYFKGYNDNSESFEDVWKSTWFSHIKKHTRQATRNKSTPRSFAKNIGGVNG
jgi:hypothetical protein